MTVVQGAGRLYLWFPDRETWQRAERHLAEHGPRTLDGHGLVFLLESRETAPLAEALAAVLGSRDGVRLLWVPDDREPGLDDFLRVVPLQRFRDSESGAGG